MPIQPPPPGFRFLIQLVNARSQAEAAKELAKMYGQRTAAVALFVPGTVHPLRTWENWIPKNKGFTAYIPVKHIL